MRQSRREDQRVRHYEQIVTGGKLPVQNKKISKPEMRIKAAGCRKDVSHGKARAGHQMHPPYFVMPFQAPDWWMLSFTGSFCIPAAGGPGGKAGIMKIRKTRQENRGTYTFQFQDGTSYVIRPGENGVTEADIRLLHAMDDHEVYINCKNGRPPLSEKEKAAKADWERRHPGERYPAGWNLSLDYLAAEEDEDTGKSRVLRSACTYMMEDNPAADQLQEMMETMTEKQREVFRLVKLDGYSQTETAALLGTSIPNVKKHLDKAVEHIRKYIS